MATLEDHIVQVLLFSLAAAIETHNVMSLMVSREEAGLDDNKHFMVFHHYDDSVTFKLVGAVSKVLGNLSYLTSIPDLVRCQTVYGRF